LCRKLAIRQGQEKSANLHSFERQVGATQQLHQIASVARIDYLSWRD